MISSVQMTALRSIRGRAGGAAAIGVVRGMSTSDVPRITERRPDETGRGGRASDAGVKVAVFGATGFLGRYVCSGLGELLFIITIFSPRVGRRCYFGAGWGEICVEGWIGWEKLYI